MAANPTNHGTQGNRSGLRAVPPGSRQIPVEFLNAIGRAIDQARVVPGNALAHFETAGGTFLEPTENGREFLHPFFIQYLGDKPGDSGKGLMAMAEGRIMGRADAERGAWAKETPRGFETAESLGIYGLWGTVPANGLPTGSRSSDDLSIITIGAGLELAQSISANSALVQSNMPSYWIDISADWRLIAIKAVGRDSDETPKGWTFELVNLPLAEVQKYYNPAEAEYDPPRIVDRELEVVRGDTAAMPTEVNEALGELPNHPAQLDSWEEKILPKKETESEVMLEDPIAGGVKPIKLEWQYRYALHRQVEIGTYFLPIAYHRSTAQGLEIQQVARSDFHFFPVPRMHTWVKWAEPLKIIWGTTELPPP